MTIATHYIQCTRMNKELLSAAQRLANIIHSRFDLHSSAAYSSSKRFRREYVTVPRLTLMLIASLSVMETMKYLITKFPDGYEGWAKENEISA